RFNALGLSEPGSRRPTHRIEQLRGVEIALSLGPRVPEQRLTVKTLRVEDLDQAAAAGLVGLLGQRQRFFRRGDGDALGAKERRVVFEGLEGLRPLPERQEYRLPIAAKLRVEGVEGGPPLRLEGAPMEERCRQPGRQVREESRRAEQRPGGGGLQG